MHTEHLMEGLQIFAIGFGGVFVNLGVILLMMLLIGRVLRWLEGREKAADAD